MTTGKTVLCQKDPQKGNAVDNYRPISCLPLMWKLMTGIISESMYVFLEENDVLPVEQKGCRRKSRGTKDQLLINKAIQNDCKRKHKNLAMAWVDYKKAYDMVPHSWIIESLKLAQAGLNIAVGHRSMTDNFCKMTDVIKDLSVKLTERFYANIWKFCNNCCLSKFEIK